MDDYTTPTFSKPCSCCKQIKTLDQFHRDKSKRDGCTSTCKECAKLRVYNWYYQNRNRAIERNRRHYQEHKTEILATNRQWRLNNYEQVRQKRKEWREKNADYLREYRKKNNDHGVTLFRIWFKEHGDKEKRRDYMRAYMQWYRQIRRARKSDLPCNFSEADWRNTTTYFDGCCAVCGRPPGLWHTIAMDHWVPLSAPDCPGTIPANMIPLCHGIDGCNNSKHNKTPHKWLVSKFGKRKAAAILRRIEGYFASLTA